MRSLRKLRKPMLAVAVSLAAVWAVPAAAQAVGVQRISASAPERGGPITITLWYPADEGGQAVSIGGGKVFEGVEGRDAAPIAPGRFPLVLLAHGGMRSAPDADAWLASELAERGFVAASIRGPELDQGDAAAAVAEFWLRPLDLSAAVSALEADPAWARHIDQDAVAVVGFFLGGTSALVLSAASFDTEAFRSLCDRKAAGPDCAWFAEAGVDLSNVSPDDLARAKADPRIKTVIAIDPEYSGSFSAPSLARISVPVTLINLGEGERIIPRFDASQLASAIPGAQYDTVPEASPFSAFALCTPKGAEILAAEGDASPCEEPAQHRAAIHGNLADRIVASLRLGLRR